jgi:hypothetical protein
MSTSAAGRPVGLFLGTARTVALGFAVLAAGLAVQLARHDALAGGRVARQAIPHDAPGWELPHFVANGVSVLGGSVVTPALLLTLAAVLAVRSRRFTPLVGAVVAVLLLDACVGAGKLAFYSAALSGPATTSVVSWGVAAWLLRDVLAAPTRRTLHLVAASAALVIGVAQLYLGHELVALLASWALAGVILAALAALARRTRTHASGS